MSTLAGRGRGRGRGILSLGKVSQPQGSKVGGWQELETNNCLSPPHGDKDIATNPSSSPSSVTSPGDNQKDVYQSAENIDKVSTFVK